jgi:hypothetical protein
MARKAVARVAEWEEDHLSVTKCVDDAISRGLDLRSLAKFAIKFVMQKEWMHPGGQRLDDRQDALDWGADRAPAQQASCC